MRIAIFLMIFFAFTSMLSGQHSVDGYIPETDPLVLKTLENWQDRKFGLFMHWGIYSQWAIVASWSYCSEDMGWNPREKGRYQNYDQYKEDYRNLQNVFNPVKFKPEEWVKAAKEAGMQYVVFTTKHHDGFCMFETKTTEFKITSSACPFHSNPKANITKEIFDAFKKEGFLTGAYFSKADWDCKYYWWPYFATPDRHVNYDPAKYPERWNKFKNFTYQQIEELMTGYGQVDILWLDGGWVRPYNNIPTRFERWAKKKNWNQDIDMDWIVKMARGHQPGLILVDRTVSGKHENYVTPEGSIPKETLHVPWETCMTMAKSGWSYRENQEFLSVHNLIHILVDIVSKGGNLLLNIGPNPEGDWPAGAYDRLKGIGSWMKVNDEAIYETHSVKPYKDGQVRLTQHKKTHAVYAIYLGDEDEMYPPSEISINGIKPSKNAKITMLGIEGELKWKKDAENFTVNIPKEVKQQPPCKHAWTIKISGIVD